MNEVTTLQRCQKVKCPIPSCIYETDDLDAAIVAALITAHSITHAPGPSTKIERVKRPAISLAGTSEDWAYFQSRWQEYVAATKLEGKDKVIQLIECCDEPLRKDLTRSSGGKLSDKTFDEVLAAIKLLAVREENIMVARVNLANMRQDRDETVRSFGARIRGQANICSYVIKCPNCATDVHYTNNILRDVLTKGLYDSDIQLDLLGKPDQDKSLEEVFKYVEAKEAGRRSASSLLDSNAAAAASSTYRKIKGDIGVSRKPRDTTPNYTEICSYCGRKGHGESAPSRVRRSVCPAYGHICTLCNRNHHMESVCRSKDKQKIANNNNNMSNASTVFDALCTLDTTINPFDDFCTLSDFGFGRAIRIDHHIYDKLTDTWVKKRPASQPFIEINAKVSHDDHVVLGFELKNKRSLSATCTIPAMADTGCQSCLAGVGIIHRLGLREADLMPVTMKMHSATQAGIRIIGATILRLSATTATGSQMETRQMVYITDATDKLFLSREACLALGLINDSFPSVGEHTTNAAMEETHQQVQQHSRNCPKRQLLPAPPTKLPFPAKTSC